MTSFLKAYSDNAVFMNDNLIVNHELLVFFEKDDILTAGMIEDIEAEHRPSTKRGMFVNIMRRRGQRGFERFIEALMRTGQIEIAHALDKRLADSWENKVTAPTTSGASVQTRSGARKRDFKDTGEPVITIDIASADKVEARRMIQNKECYPFKSKCRGRAIIVNIQTFDPKLTTLENRAGSDLDAHNLKGLYTRLGFTVESWKNLSKNDMMTNVKKERLHSDHAKADAFIFTILSHGGRGFVYCSDGQKLVLEQLYELFDGNECPALIGKPKIFIIQACQGRNQTRGVRSDGDDSTEEPDEPNQEQPLVCADAIGSLPSVHERADFVFACCAVPGYKSYRNTANGTFFIRALIYTFINSCHSEHFQDMLVEVNNKLQKDGFKWKQVGETKFTTTRKIYFLPDYHE